MNTTTETNEINFNHQPTGDGYRVTTPIAGYSVCLRPGTCADCDNPCRFFREHRASLAAEMAAIEARRLDRPVVDVVADLAPEPARRWPWRSVPAWCGRMRRGGSVASPWTACGPPRGVAGCRD
jgi:hypothetical protein